MNCCDYVLGDCKLNVVSGIIAMEYNMLSNTLGYVSMVYFVCYVISFN